MLPNNVVIVHVHKQVYLLIGRHFSCSDNFSLSIHVHVVAQVKSSSQLNQSFSQLSRSGAASTIGATMITEFAILVLYFEINSMNYTNCSSIRHPLNQMTLPVSKTATMVITDIIIQRGTICCGNKQLEEDIEDPSFSS